MKNITPLVVALALIAGVGTVVLLYNQRSSTQTSVSANQTYYNPAKEIKFEYPSVWKIDPQIVDGPNPIIAKFDRERDTSLLLLHMVNDSKLTFDSYKKSSMEELEFSPGFALISETTGQIGNITAYQVTGSFENNVKSRWYYFMSPDNSRLFVITYRSTQDKFESYLGEVESIVGSVETK